MRSANTLQKGFLGQLVTVTFFLTPSVATTEKQLSIS